MTAKLYALLSSKNFGIGTLRQRSSSIKFRSFGQKWPKPKEFLGMCLTVPKIAESAPWSFARVIGQR